LTSLLKSFFSAMQNFIHARMPLKVSLRHTFQIKNIAKNRSKISLISGLCLSMLIGLNTVIKASVFHQQVSNIDSISSEVALKWGVMTLQIMKKTPGGSPTYGSRSLGYLGLTMYESVVGGVPNKRSLAGQLKGLKGLEKPSKGKKYNWVLSLNAGQSLLLKKLYKHTSLKNINTIDSLEREVYLSELKNTPPKVAEQSIKLGQAIATSIFEWSKKDGGDEGYARNFDSTYKVPLGDGYWIAPAKGQSLIPLPLHHTWGQNRTFATNNGTLPIPKMIAYNFKPNSEYYALMFEVYTKRKTLSQEEKEIANWWGDDPSETFSPPGHSYNLANITVRIAKPNLFKAAETYARVGMAVADAFINCWKAKYFYHAQRPYDFIFHNIDTLWDLYWPEPPFPAFYSGHAVQGAATATVLTELYGPNFKFVDDSHLGRARDRERLIEYKIRKFDSFWAAAEESAMSRLYGGIHTRQDNEVGLAEGKKIGRNINALLWNKE
jgi:PAP2 superfamily